MGKQWIKALLAIGGLALTGRLLGFLLGILTAAFFGIGPTTDAYLLAMVIFDFAFVANRTVVSSTVGYFGQSISSEGEIVVPKTFSKHLIFSLVLVGILFIPIITWGTPYLFTASDPRIIWEFKLVAYLLVPTALMVIFAGMQSGMLQLLGRSDSPAFAALFFNAFAIAFLLAGHSTIGVLALPLGFLLGAAMFVIWQVWMLRKFSRGRVIKQESGVGGFGKWGRLSLSFFVAQMVSSLGIITDRYFALQLPTGSYSVLAFASRIVQLPYSIVSYAISTSLLPIQSRSALRDGELASITERGLLVGLGMSGIISVLFYVFATPLVKIIYERGQFTESDTLVTASVLGVLALGLVPLILNPILTNVAYVFDSPRSLLRVGVITIISYTATMWLLVNLLGSVRALAWTFSLGSWFYFGLLLFELRMRHGFRLNGRFWREFGQVVVCAVAVALIGEIASPLFPGNDNSRSIGSLIVSTGLWSFVLLALYASMLAFLFRSTIRRVFLKLSSR